METKIDSKKKNGLFIVVEGIDGSGKTTLCNGLFNNWDNQGMSVLLTKEPTDKQYGREFKTLIQNNNTSIHEQVDLIILDRIMHINEVVQPSLSLGMCVLCDRYIYSNIVYQSILGFPESILVKLNENFPKPDLILFILCNPELAYKRLNDSNKNKDMFEHLDILIRMHNKYSDMFKDMPNVETLDGSLSPMQLMRQANESCMPLIANRL